MLHIMATHVALNAIPSTKHAAGNKSTAGSLLCGHTMRGYSQRWMSYKYREKPAPHRGHCYRTALRPPPRSLGHRCGHPIEALPPRPRGQASPRPLHERAPPVPVPWKG